VALDTDFVDIERSQGATPYGLGYSYQF
jgi:hypothetical protein